MKNKTKKIHKSRRSLSHKTRTRRSRSRRHRRSRSHKSRRIHKRIKQMKGGDTAEIQAIFKVITDVYKEYIYNNTTFQCGLKLLIENKLEYDQEVLSIKDGNIKDYIEQQMSFNKELMSNYDIIYFKLKEYFKCKEKDINKVDDNLPICFDSFNYYFGDRNNIRNDAQERRDENADLEKNIKELSPSSEREPIYYLATPTPRPTKDGGNKYANNNPTGKLCEPVFIDYDKYPGILDNIDSGFCFLTANDSEYLVVNMDNSPDRPDNRRDKRRDRRRDNGQDSSPTVNDLMFKMCCTRSLKERMERINEYLINPFINIPTVNDVHRVKHSFENVLSPLDNTIAIFIKKDTTYEIKYFIKFWNNDLDSYIFTGESKFGQPKNENPDRLKLEVLLNNKYIIFSPEKTDEINKILTSPSPDNILTSFSGINGIRDGLKTAISNDIETNTIVECYSSSEKV
jgi:hypothetical protein